MDLQQELGGRISPQSTATKELEERLKSISLSIQIPDTKPAPKNPPVPKITPQLRDYDQVKKSEFRSIYLNHKQYRRILKRRSTRKRLLMEQGWSHYGHSSKPELLRLVEQHESGRVDKSRKDGDANCRVCGQQEKRDKMELETAQEGMKGEVSEQEWL